MLMKRFEYIKGYVFVGNIPAQTETKLIKEKQLQDINFIIGTQAYDIEGKPLSDSYKPLYIKEGKDFIKYDDLQMQKLSTR